MIKNIYKKLFSEKVRNEMRESRNRLFSPLYYGNRFYCNCCNKSFRRFLPKGNIKRLNAQCPFCSSLERTRVLDLFIRDELNIYNAENIKILHFAPEFGLFRKLRKIKNVIYIDADLNPAYARNVIDVTNIPFPENYFDYILCSHVLGHVPDEQLAVKELYRVLKKGGVALILSLISHSDETFEDDNIITPIDRLKFYGEDNLCRLHGRDFADRLRTIGFFVEEIDYRLKFSVEVQKKFALGNGDREVIFKCIKQ